MAESNVAPRGGHLSSILPRSKVQIFQGKPLCWCHISCACCSAPRRSAKLLPRGRWEWNGNPSAEEFPRRGFCLVKVLLGADKDRRGGSVHANSLFEQPRLFTTRSSFFSLVFFCGFESCFWVSPQLELSLLLHSYTRLIF